MPAPLELRLQPDPERLTLGRFLDDVSARHAERPALRIDGRSVSYRELRAGSRRLARGLVAAGVVKGARVGVMVTNRPEWVVGTFAAGLVGAVVVPVSTLATSDERDYVLRHSDVSTLLLQRSLRSRDYLEELLVAHPELGESAPGRLRCRALPSLRRLACFDGSWGAGGGDAFSDLVALGDDVPEALLDEMAAQISPADDGMLIYTSGTTAHPKGVLHTQRAPVIQSWRFAELMRISPDDRVFTAQPFFWTAGIAMSLGATLAAGACLVMQEVFEPGEALALIEAERVTAVHAFPHQEKSLAEHTDAAARDLSSVRKTRFASPLAALAGIEKDVWGVDASFGLSETFTIAAMLPSDAPAELRRASSGRPLPGTEIHIVDPETGAVLPEGQTGEIAVRGATLMRGYQGVAPEDTFDPEGFFHTGDGGWLDAEGLLHWTGRLSGLIKTGGANVSPIEIEHAIASYPGLKLAVAVGVPHPTLGEVLVLCVVAAEEALPDEARIRRFLREKLSAFKVPRRVLFFAEDEIAWTATSKVQTAPLRATALRRLRDEGAEIDGYRYSE
jgi:fatty-acyl-CoA synthase